MIFFVIVLHNEFEDELGVSKQSLEGIGVQWSTCPWFYDLL